MQKKSLAKNFAYNISYQILLLILPLITTPYVSRVLGADGIGTYGYTNSITQYFILFGCIGMNLYGQREAAYCQNDEVNRSKIFWELLIVRFFSITLSVLVYFFLVCQSNRYGAVFRIQLIDIFANLIDIAWFFQGLEEFKKIVIRNSIVKLCGLAGIFLFVHSSDDIYIYTLIYSLSLFLGNASMWMYVPRYVVKVKASELNCKHHLKPAFLLFVPQIATNIYNLLDKSMIGFITGNDSEVAYYEQAQKIMKIALAIPTSLGTVMLPRVANLFSEDNMEVVKQYLYKSMCFIAMLTFPLCFGLIGIAHDFVPWFYGTGYDRVVGNLIFISPVIIAVGFSNVMGVQYLLPVGKQNEYTISVVVGTLCNFAFNSLLIPRFLSFGAAVGSVIAEFSVTLTQAIILKKEFDFKAILSHIWKYVFSSFIMMILILAFSHMYKHTNFFATFIEIILGVFIYFGLLFVLKDTFLKTYSKQIFDKIKNR